MARSTSALLKRVYSLSGPDEAARVYNEWSATYDLDTVQGMGYVAPGLAADRLTEVVTAPATVLDAGCGTGLVGAELAKRADLTVDGVDLSPGMLAKAEARGVYRTLATADLTARLGLPTAGYDGLICVGTLTGGHVGPAAFDEFIRVVRPGGYVVATVHEDVWESGGYRDRLHDMDERGSIRLHEAEKRPYHTRTGMNAFLCTLEIR